MTGKRIVLAPIDINETILAAKVTGPGQRATLSAMIQDGMTAVTIRVNDVEGVAGFVLPGDRVDVVLTRQNDKSEATSDVVEQNARVIAVDQLADVRAEKPSVVKSVTLEVSVVDGQRLALAANVGTLSLLLRKAGETADGATREVTLNDLSHPHAVTNNDSGFVSIGITRGSKLDRYKVPVEGAGAASAALSRQGREAN
jgi:pilus assembly protein CpaB